MTRRKPARAIKGTISTAILVRLDADLAKQVERAAKKDGASVAEWMRRAAHERILRAAAARLGLMG